ncbi:MAG TPA: stage II sporulation protein M [Bacillota bacterium]|nr:stage II sporulation protein M [Bacillota bacterium]
MLIKSINAFSNDMNDEFYEVFQIKDIFQRTLFIRAIKFLLFSLALTVIALFVTYVANPDIGAVTEGISRSIDPDLKEATGIKKVWAYIVNNGFMVPLQMIALAIVPIQFLYVLNIATTVTLPGILFALVLRADASQGLKLMIATIPHYMLEVIAYCLLAAALFKVNEALRGKIKSLFRKENCSLSFNKYFIQTVALYVVFVLPIIIIAAFTETYVADMILNVLQ